MQLFFIILFVPTPPFQKKERNLELRKKLNLNAYPLPQLEFVIVNCAIHTSPKCDCTMGSETKKLKQFSLSVFHYHISDKQILFSGPRELDAERETKGKKLGIGSYLPVSHEECDIC